MNSLNQKIGIVMVFLTGVFIGFWISNIISPNIDVVSDEELVDEFVGAEGISTSLIVKGENNLVVSTQPAGNSVTMSMVLISQSGWVAIHENVEGNLGGILGARRFDEGKYFGEKIELLRNTEVEKTYSAVLHSDNGDNEFDFKTEIPVEDFTGSMILENFFVTDSSI